MSVYNHFTKLLDDQEYLQIPRHGFLSVSRWPENFALQEIIDDL
jgi:hypothetical protein